MQMKPKEITKIFMIILYQNKKTFGILFFFNIKLFQRFKGYVIGLI